jgi:purine-nucleoside phosphorylase
VRSWTTDAPYRETVEELRHYRSDGVATVEMEASALLAVGAYRGVSVSSVFVISDLLSEEDWNQGYHSEEKLEALKQVFEVALEAIALDSSDNQKHAE